MSELKRIGASMANVMFNLAQKAGEPLEARVCFIMGRLRREWDEACRTASPSPASDAELPPLPKPSWIGCYGVDQFSADQMRAYGQECARAASARTASDTRTAMDRLRETAPEFAAHLDWCSREVATWPKWKQSIDAASTDVAGEAGCDSALRAEPAGQHDAGAAVAWRRVDWDSGKWIFTDQQPTEETAWEGLCVAKPAARRAEVSIDAERPAFDLWWRASKYCQVVTHKDGWMQIALDGWLAKARTASANAPAGPACQGGNTQPVSVESTRPAEACSPFPNSESGTMPRSYAPEVDVKAERKWVEQAWFDCNQNIVAFAKAFAARTQADAGKDKALLDYLDQWVICNEKKGFKWFTFSFDTNKTAREQIKAEMMNFATTTPEKT